MILDKRLAQLAKDAAILGNKSSEGALQKLAQSAIKASEQREKMVKATLLAIHNFEHRREIYQEYANGLGLPALTREQKQQAMLECVLRQKDI